MPVDPFAADPSAADRAPGVSHAPGTLPAASSATVPTVVVTRPTGQSAELIAQLRAHGIAACEFPLIEITPVGDAAPLARALAELDRYALVVFVSPNAIERSLPLLGRPWPSAVPIAVIGPASVAALARAGIAAPAVSIIWPEPHGDDDARFDSEALLAALDARAGLASLGGTRVLLIRGDGGRELLAESLRTAGAAVDIVAAYRRRLPELDSDQWRTIHQLLAGAPHVWLLTSSEGVRNLLELAREHLNAAELAALKRAPLVVPHPRIAESARRLGFDRITISGAGDANVSRALFHSAEQLAFPSMTDSTASQPEPAKPAASVAPKGAPAAPPNTPFTPYEAQPRRGGRGGPGGASWWLVVLLVLVVAAGAGGGGFVLNRKLERVQQELAARQQASDAQAVENRVKTQQAIDTVHQLDTQFAQLSGKLADSQSQQQALQQAYQELAHNRDDWTLAEIGQTLSSASQQLQLTGNVHLALFALQNADARLASASSPQLLAVRRALAHDIDALKAAPGIDLSGLAIKLDDAIGRVDSLPLAGEALNRHAAAPDAAPASAAVADQQLTGMARWRGWWNRFTAGLEQQLTGLVQVRRVDNADAYLVAPDQGYFLRANLKLRLLSARLSLLARNQATLRADLGAADDMLLKYFDSGSPTTQTVLGLVRQVEPAAADLQLPNLDTSLAAVHQYKSGS